MGAADRLGLRAQSVIFIQSEWGDSSWKLSFRSFVKILESRLELSPSW